MDENLYIKLEEFSVEEWGFLAVFDNVLEYKFVQKSLWHMNPQKFKQLYPLCTQIYGSKFYLHDREREKIPERKKFLISII